MNSRFPVLSIVSLLLRIMGWLAVATGVIFAAYAGMIEPMLPRHSFGAEDAMQIVMGLADVLFGLITVALGEVIRVFVAIEQNTRVTAEFLAMMRGGRPAAGP